MTQPKNPGDEVPPGTEQSAENTCTRCNGSGKVDEAPCPACGGTGTITSLVGDA